MSTTHIPTPTIKRLCRIYRILNTLYDSPDARISSFTLGKMLHIGAHNIRKDVNHLGGIGQTRAGYSVALLKDRIRNLLGLDRVRNTCVVGLSQLGCALASYIHEADTPYSVVAGFDSDVNKIEILRTPMPLFTASEIPEVVPREHIEIGIIAVAPQHAQLQANALIDAGIKGIINATAVVIDTGGADIVMQSIDPAGELTLLSGFLHTSADSNTTRSHESTIVSFT